MCPCSCGFKAKLKKWRLKNLSKEEFLKEMEPLMKEVLDNMKMDKSQISAVIRKLTSAPDDRKSSKQIGSFGIVIIVGAFAVIIIFDILSCIRFRPRRRDWQFFGDIICQWSTIGISIMWWNCVWLLNFNFTLLIRNPLV